MRRWGIVSLFFVLTSALVYYFQTYYRPSPQLKLTLCQENHPVMDKCRQYVYVPILKKPAKSLSNSLIPGEQGLRKLKRHLSPEQIELLSEGSLHIDWQSTDLPASYLNAYSAEVVKLLMRRTSEEGDSCVILQGYPGHLDHIKALVENNNWIDLVKCPYHEGI